MAKDPQDLKYTKDHEWVRVSDSHLVIGVTDHAQESLGDVVYVELPKVGSELTAGSSFGTIESTKAVSELFAPVSGKVTKVNDALTDDPSVVNTDPYQAGWLIEVEPSDRSQLDGLLDVEAYQKVAADGG